MLDLWIEILNGILKHGISWAAAGSFAVALLKYRKSILRLIHKGKVQETQLDRIQKEIEVIMQHMGVQEWRVEKMSSLRSGEKNSLTSSLEERSFARRVDVFTARELIIISRGNRKMKKWYTSRKFLLTIATGVIVALNDALGWGLSQATITTIASVVVGWVASEAVTDAVKKTPEVTNDYTTTKDAGDV